MANNNSTALYQPESLNVNEFVYSAPHPNKTGTITNIYMNYNKSRPKIQSPMMYCTFGIGVMVDEKKKDAEPAFSVELQLGAENAKLESFTQWLENFDARVLDDCKKHSESWMKKKLSDRMAKELFKPMVKKYKDKETLTFSDKYPPRCKFKIQRKNGKFVTRFFDHNRQPIDLNGMTIEQLKQFGKGNRCRVIFEIGGIWCGAKGFGLTLKADQIMFFPPQRLTGFGFLDDIEDELIFGTSSNTAAPPASVAPPAPAVSASPPPPVAAVTPPPPVVAAAVTVAADPQFEEQEEEDTETDAEPKEAVSPASPPKSKQTPAKQATLSKYARAKKTANK